MVATEQQTTQMGKMGERTVQASMYSILENEVQRTPQFIFTLVIGMSINMQIFVTEQHEEPCEGRLSRTVLWEGKGEIPLPDPISGHCTATLQPPRDNHKQTK
jgi:hypothetical protein